MVKKEYTPFQRAILDSVLEDYKKLMADAPEIAFSPITENQAEEKRNRRNVPPVGRRIARAVLIGAIIVALLAASVMAIPALREKVVALFLREGGDSYGITFDPQAAAIAPTEIEQEYDITYLPDDCVLLSYSSSSITVKKVWVNSGGEQLMFSQWTISKQQMDIQFGVDTGSSRETVLMRDYFVNIITNVEYRELIWTDNSYCYMLEIPTSVSWEEVEKIFASWGPKE